MTPDCEASALLTLQLTDSKGVEKPLTLSEWSRFAGWLSSRKLTPSRLIGESLHDDLIGWDDPKVTVQRLENLFQRGFAIGIYRERWESAGIWCLSLFDRDYPKSLKQRLGFRAPPLLFGFGDLRKVVKPKRIAIVGSRVADDQDLEFTSFLAKLAAEQEYTVVSGGVRGVDEHARLGALENDGSVIEILSHGLLRAVTSRSYRSQLQSGNLVLLSPFNPEVGFRAYNALERNSYIYCLSDATIVVASEDGKGGTWSDAKANHKQNWVPLWVAKNSGCTGNEAVVERLSGRWLPETLEDIDELVDLPFET